MNRRSIKVDRLEIRTRGISAELVRAAISDLGPQLLERLASVPAGQSAPVRVDRIDLGRVPAPAQNDAAALRAAIARTVSSGIQSRLQAKNQRS